MQLPDYAHKYFSDHELGLLRCMQLSNRKSLNRNKQFGPEIEKNSSFASIQPPTL
jgi:hypothetical protein